MHLSFFFNRKLYQTMPLMENGNLSSVTDLMDDSSQLRVSIFTPSQGFSRKRSPLDIMGWFTGVCVLTRVDRSVSDYYRSIIRDKSKSLRTSAFSPCRKGNFHAFINAFQNEFSCIIHCYHINISCILSSFNQRVNIHVPAEYLRIGSYLLV